MKNLILLITCLIVLVANAAAKEFLVSSQGEFQKAAELVQAGDEIIIANGSYSGWELSINCHGIADKPVIIRAETSGKVIFTGDVNSPVFIATGNYTEISGLLFTGCKVYKGSGKNGVLVELKSSLHCRITDCIFRDNSAMAQFMPLVVISGKGEYNRVDHCTFTGNRDNQEAQVKITKEEVPVYTSIDNNLFKDKQKVTWKVVNGGECIQVGQDPILLGTQVSHTTVRDNQFIRCNGEAEVISNKSSANKYLHNNFEECKGELVLRGGHDCLVDSNSFKGGAGGIRVSGTHHIITNNTLTGLPVAIRLMYGMAKGKEEIGFYVAASDCLIKNNHISRATKGILIGDSKNADWTGKFDTTRYPSRTQQDIAPFNISLEGNTFTETETPVVHNEQGSLLN
jgi:poly(beta-D-mannuronate) lyase